MKKHQRNEKKPNPTPRDGPSDNDQFDEPGDHDVICGRGGRALHHGGNKRFRSLVRSAFGQYERIPKFEKGKLAGSIVKQIQSKGGKYIKKNKETGKWYCVPDRMALRKTSQAFRDHRTKVFEKKDPKQPPEQIPDWPDGDLLLRNEDDSVSDFLSHILAEVGLEFSDEEEDSDEKDDDINMESSDECSDNDTKINDKDDEDDSQGGGDNDYGMATPIAAI